MDIDTSASRRPESEGYRAALQRLHAAQKSSVGAPAYSRFVNRPLGRRFAALAYVAHWTPNAVTLVSALASFTGITLIATVVPSWWSGILITALLVLGYALDAADGQLARLRGGGSIQGEWLDHTVDAGKVIALHLAVLIAAYRFFELPTWWLLVPMGYLLVDTLVFFSWILKDLLVARVSGGRVAPSTSPPGMVRSLLVIPTDYGLVCLIFLLIGAPRLFAVVYTLLLAGNVVYLALALAKWYRLLGALSTQKQT